MNEILNSVGFDHVEIAVADLRTGCADYVDRWGFDITGESGSAETGHRSVALRQGDASLVLTQGLDDAHPASRFVRAHGDGVFDIALRTTDARAAFAAAVAGGARPLAAPQQVDGAVTATIEAFGDVRHTFVQRPGHDVQGALPPGLLPTGSGVPGSRFGLGKVDHFAVLVEAGRLIPTVQYYESALGFRQIFEEDIVVGAQAMQSQVVQNAAGDVTLTVIAPSPGYAQGQIDDFITANEGAGVQHVAFTSRDIVRSVSTLQDHGVAFLTTPDSYYDLLPSRLTLAGYSVAELRELKILADADHGGQLYQIFSRSTHPRKTLFLEVIERLGAETFGSGNIKALYEAVELERSGTGAHR